MNSMSERHDRDELVELMSRYANVPDTQNWDELPRSVFCDEFTCGLQLARRTGHDVQP